MRIIGGKLIAEGMKVAIVASRFNEFIVGKLIEGANDTLVRHGCSDDDIDLVWVPGAYEIPLIANVVAADEPAAEAESGSNTLTKSLEIGLIVLVVLLVILGLIIGFNKLKDNEPREEEVGQTYY